MFRRNIVTYPHPEGLDPKMEGTTFLQDISKIFASLRGVKSLKNLIFIKPL
jgi:hypothetical protein